MHTGAGLAASSRSGSPRPRPVLATAREVADRDPEGAKRSYKDVACRSPDVSEEVSRYQEAKARAEAAERSLAQAAEAKFSAPTLELLSQEAAKFRAEAEQCRPHSAQLQVAQQAVARTCRSYESKQAVEAKCKERLAEAKEALAKAEQEHAESVTDRQVAWRAVRSAYVARAEQAAAGLQSLPSGVAVDYSKAEALRRQLVDQAEATRQCSDDSTPVDGLAETTQAAITLRAEARAMLKQSRAAAPASNAAPLPASPADGGESSVQAAEARHPSPARPQTRPRSPTPRSPSSESSTGRSRSRDGRGRVKDEDEEMCKPPAPARR